MPAAAEGAEDVDLRAWPKPPIKRTGPLAIHEHTHVLADPVLLVDEAKPDPRELSVEIPQRILDRTPGHDDRRLSLGIGPQLLRYENRHAQRRATASME